jgi:hypothetical protein
MLLIGGYIMLSVMHVIDDNLSLIFIFLYIKNYIYMKKLDEQPMEPISTWVRMDFKLKKYIFF